jgi:hypothetical protein
MTCKCPRALDSANRRAPLAHDALGDAIPVHTSAAEVESKRPEAASRIVLMPEFRGSSARIACYSKMHQPHRDALEDLQGSPCTTHLNIRHGPSPLCHRLAPVAAILILYKQAIALLLAHPPEYIHRSATRLMDMAPTNAFRMIRRRRFTFRSI